jgi:hypothetical protein
MACSSLGRGELRNSSAAGSARTMRMMVGLTILPLPPPFLDDDEREVLKPLRPPRLPPRPNLLRPIVLAMRAVVVVVVSLLWGEDDQGWGWRPPFSGSLEEVVVVAVLVLAGRLPVAMTLRANQPPRSRERKMGRRAGAEAVMRARLVSMAEVTKPTLLEAELGKMDTMKSPWTRITRRMMEVIVTLWGG